MGLAAVAARLHQQALHEAGETFTLAKFTVAFGGGIIVSAAFAAFAGFADGVMVGSLFVLLQSHYLLAQTSTRPAPPSVNPVRQSLIHGAVLAYAGLFISFAGILSLFIAVIRQF